MKISLFRQELQAALLFASNDSTRFVLNSVFIECGAANLGPLLVATDGRSMAVLETECPQTEIGKFNLLLSAPFVSRVCRLSAMFGGKKHKTVEIEACHGKNAVAVTFPFTAYSMRLELGAIVEGSFPAWRGVWLKKGTPAKALPMTSLSSECMRHYLDAAKILGASSHIIHLRFTSETNPVEVLLSGLPRFRSIIMPGRTDYGGLDWNAAFANEDVPLQAKPNV